MGRDIIRSQRCDRHPRRQQKPAVGTGMADARICVHRGAFVVNNNSFPQRVIEIETR